MALARGAKKEIQRSQQMQRFTTLSEANNKQIPSRKQLVQLIRMNRTMMNSWYEQTLGLEAKMSFSKRSEINHRESTKHRVRTVKKTKTFGTSVNFKSLGDVGETRETGLVYITINCFAVSASAFFEETKLSPNTSSLQCSFSRQA